MLNILKKFTLFLLLTITIQAEDICPIKIQFYNGGVPQWIDSISLLKKLKSKASKKNKDPLLENLIKYSNKQDCVKAIQKETSFDLEQSIHKKSFINLKSFNCKSAYKKLNSIKSLQGEGNVVMIRGSHRVLISLVGEKSFCIQSYSYDGARLNYNSLKRLYKRLLGNYINHKLESLDKVK
ncbi:MAG: hypothetical protein KAU90_00875 [Sulfurovaceae bacterium]|nr:hypothetical protein [Sulfurovaceae bacterium]